MGQKRGRQAGPCLTLWAGPRPPLACCGLLNYIDFASPGFSVHRVGRAPSFPAILSQGGWQPEELRLAVTVPPLGEQARLGDCKVIQYLFIYSPWVGLVVSQPLSALSPECLETPALPQLLWLLLVESPILRPVAGPKAVPDILALTHLPVNVSPSPSAPSPALGGWVNGQENEAKASTPSRVRRSPPRRAEPYLRRAGLAGPQACGSTRAAPGLLGLLPAQEGACT